MNLEVILQEHGVEYIDSGHHHCHEGWIQLNCPFCTDGAYGWHLGYNLETHRFNCWRCGKHSVWEVLNALIPLPKGALYKLTQEVRRGAPDTKPQRVVVRKALPKAPLGTGPLDSQHKRYLRKRRFSPARLINEWDIKATGHLSGEWSWRIVIPIYDEEGNIEAYQGRTISKSVKPKYRTSEGAPSDLLYGIHRAKGDAVIIVEGVTDVWRLGAGAVATMGVDWGKEQANRLRRYDRRYIAFDPEETAQRRAEELARWLAFFPGVTEIVEDLRTDPGDLSDNESVDLMRQLNVREK